MKGKEQMVTIPAKEHEMLVSIANLISDAHMAEEYPEFATEFGVSPESNMKRAKEIVWEYESYVPLEFPA